MEDTFDRRPVTVEFMTCVKPIVLTKPAVPKPTMVLVSSIGSINELIYVWMPCVVEKVVEKRYVEGSYKVSAV
jgi:hypothetical protein